LSIKTFSTQNIDAFIADIIIGRISGKLSIAMRMKLFPVLNEIAETKVSTLENPQLPKIRIIIKPNRFLTRSPKSTVKSKYEKSDSSIIIKIL
jgi:hypothetical protein